MHLQNKTADRSQGKNMHYNLLLAVLCVKKTCSKNAKTVREMGDDKDIPKVGKKYSNFGLPSVVGGSTSHSFMSDHVDILPVWPSGR